MGIHRDPLISHRNIEILHCDECMLDVRLDILIISKHQQTISRVKALDFDTVKDF